MKKPKNYCGIAVACLLTTSHPGVFAALLNPAQIPMTETVFADFNNDDRADAITRDLSTGVVTIRFNQGSRFSETANVTTPAGTSVPDVNNWESLFADFNGDGLADLVNRHLGSGDFFVHFASSAGFSSVANVAIQGLSPAAPTWMTLFADVNGDQFADLVNIDRTNGTVFVHYNSGPSGQVGFGTGANIVQQGLAVPVIDNTWTYQLADVTGDGKAEFFNIHQTSSSFHAHENTGNGFNGTATYFTLGIDVPYEYQQLLADANADGVADLVSLDLRSGRIAGYPVLHPSRGASTYGRDDRPCVLGNVSTYNRPHRGIEVPPKSNRSIEALVWYDNDYNFGINRPEGGWFALNPQHPNTVTSPGIFRGIEPLLTTTDQNGNIVPYRSDDPATIRQHAYWLRALGATGIIIDWTNLLADVDTAPDFLTYTTKLKTATETLLSTYSNVTAVVPPRVMIAVSITHGDVSKLNRLVNEVYSLYNRTDKKLWVKFDDGTGNRELPLLLVFANLGEAPWATSGPPWNDSRFNVRFFDGYLASKTVTQSVSTEALIVRNNWPYWAFVENQIQSNRSGYYKAVFRTLSDGTYEQSATWVAVYISGATWDGMLDQVGGLSTITRFSDPLFNSPPRISLIQRFNYSYARLDQPQEGVSLNGSTFIEPSKDLGFSIYDETRRATSRLLGGQGHAPAAPVILSRASIGGGNWRISFALNAGATEYRLNSGAWRYIDINAPWCDTPLPVTIEFRNAFGGSAQTVVN